MDFYTLRHEARLNREKAAILFDVSDRTIRNWDTGRIRPPRAVFLYLHVLCGHLDHMGKHWQGFRFYEDVILSPEGDHLHYWEVRAIRYLFHAAGISRAKLSRPLRTTQRSTTESQSNIVPIRKINR